MAADARARARSAVYAAVGGAIMLYLAASFWAAASFESTPPGGAKSGRPPLKPCSGRVGTPLG